MDSVTWISNATAVHETIAWIAITADILSLIIGLTVGVKLLANFVAVKVVTFGAVNTFSIAVKNLTVDVWIRLFDIQDAWAIDERETTIAASANECLVIEFFAEGVDFCANFVFIEIETIRTLHTTLIFKFGAVDVYFFLILYDYTNSVGECSTVIAAQAVPIFIIECFAERIDHCADSIAVHVVIFWAFSTNRVIIDCASDDIDILFDNTSVILKGKSLIALTA